MNTSWPRARLSESDLEAIHATHWRRFPTTTVIAIVEASNAGLTDREIARDLKCRRGSVRLTLNRASQRGVRIRLAHEPPFSAEPVLRTLSPVDRALTALQIHRLERLASLGLNDPLLRKCLNGRRRDQRRQGVRHV